MPRPREFDEDQVVQRAMEIFWRKGYRATSVQDLVDETGVNRASLYTTFGDKHGLFLRAMRHYCSSVVPKRVGILESENASIPEILEYFDAVVADLLGAARHRGCLMANSAIELAATDSDVERRVSQHLDRLERAFAGALARARELGELRRETNLEALSRFLVNTSQGLMMTGKARPDERRLRDVVETALEVLGDRR